jgi:hypothetical protein
MLETRSPARALFFIFFKTFYFKHAVNGTRFSNFKELKIIAREKDSRFADFLFETTLALEFSSLYY